MDQLDYGRGPATGLGAASPSARRARAAEVLFVRHATRIYNVARRMLGDEAEAEDVARDALLCAVSNLDDLAADADLAGRLRSVVVKAVIRRRCARPRGAICRPPGETPAGTIEDMIVHLPEVYRDVYVLVDVEGCTDVAVGELLGVSPAAVKNRLRRARALVRGFLAVMPKESSA